MTNSQFCLQQRQQEQQRLRKLLVVGFVGSAAVHGILAYALPKWSFDPPQQAEEPIEMILVDKPKPEPKPKPKIESKPIVKPKPKPVQPPEPVKAQTPPPPVKPPEPVKAQTAPPKPAPEPTPAPKKVVTDPTPAPSQPIVSVPVENTGQSSSLSSSFTSSSSSVAASSSSASSNGKPGITGSVVATGSAPPRPEANDGGEEGISCVSNCEPEYPASLEGTEGSAGVKLTIDSNGNVIGAELADPDSNSGINRQALLAARQMQFSSPGDNAASVQVKIDFTVEGSQYDRARREEQEKREQAARERQEQEAARQQQLEAERQARQEQLERERQAREQQQLQQQQESAPPPAAETKPAPEPLPALSEEELDEERLRKFRERIENYQ
ncbi:TonB family protein [Pleurocapsales cyanobacterium LEGE 10410]|nr:TonB family protein [Pleurocapsales cyanobacterium LEGE 10410]